MALTFCYAVFGLSGMNDDIIESVAPTPKLSEQQYTLRLVVVPCWYLTIPSPFFQPISSSPSSHISYISVLHLLHRRIHPCCPESSPLWSSTSIFTADFVWHLNYPGATIRSQVGSRSLSIFAQYIAILTTHFVISVIPHLICCHTTYPPPPYPSQLSWISFNMLVRP